MCNKFGWRPRPPCFAPASTAFFGAGGARTHLASRVGSAHSHLASRLLQPHSSGGGPSNAALAHKVPLPFPCCFVRAEGPPKLTWHSGLPEAGTRRSDFGEVFTDRGRYCQVLCANSFTSLAELCLHRAGEPALDCPIAEGRERVKGGEAACEALDASSGFCYQPASSSCTSRCFMLMYFFPPH